MLLELTFATAGIGALTGAYGIASYNRAVTLAQRCDQAVADVDVQLRHRHDLIPALVETVKGFSKHERALFDTVMSARAQAMQAKSEEERTWAEALVGTRLHNVIATVESYPEAKASPHFCELRRELSDVENKIAAARRFQNMAVSEYNATIAQFPMNMLAGRFGLNERRSFGLGLDRVFVEEAPGVSF